MLSPERPRLIFETTLYDGPGPQTGEFIVWDETAGGRVSRPPAFQGGGGGLVSTVDD
ncbi:hypothetical protein [Nonomuraea sp. NPDC049480]|uniref:hypothetical protein n=1 Tax=Nonomuraea sp. NPDC049480 TaxID=3364353 RepID=UPI0037B03635